MVKLGLEQVGKAEYFNEDLIKEALKGQEGYSKRQVAELLNKLVFGGL